MRLGLQRMEDFIKLSRCLPAAAGQRFETAAQQTDKLRLPAASAPLLLPLRPLPVAHPGAPARFTLRFAKRREGVVMLPRPR